MRRPHIGSFLSHTPALAMLALGVQTPSHGAAQGLRFYVINTVVGSGPRNVESGGYGGDGGPATRALINTPTGVALDAAGNLFFCDWNARIRKVAVGTGIITTVAGTGTAGYS